MVLRTWNEYEEINDTSLSSELFCYKSNSCVNGMQFWLRHFNCFFSMEIWLGITTLSQCRPRTTSLNWGSTPFSAYVDLEQPPIIEAWLLSLESSNKVQLLTLRNGITLSTLSISSHGFVLGFPKGLITMEIYFLIINLWSTPNVRLLPTTLNKFGLHTYKGGS